VRLGLRLGYDGSVPPFVSQPEHGVGTGLKPGTHTAIHDGTPATAGATSWATKRAA
jgi:hypothetical protein